MSTTQQADHPTHKPVQVNEIIMRQLDDQGRETDIPRAHVLIYRCTECGKSGFLAFGHGTRVGVNPGIFSMERCFGVNDTVRVPESALLL